MVLGPSRSPGEQEPVITDFPDWQLLRLRSDGSLDPGFGHAGLLTASGIRVPSEGPTSQLRPELTPGGGIMLPTIIGPVFSPATVSALVRLNADGSRDSSFAAAGRSSCRAPSRRSRCSRAGRPSLRCARARALR